jgi:hypothetical protein
MFVDAYAVVCRLTLRMARDPTGVLPRADATLDYRDGSMGQLAEP